MEAKVKVKITSFLKCKFDAEVAEKFLNGIFYAKGVIYAIAMTDT